MRASCALALVMVACAPDPVTSTLISGVRLADGTGAPLRTGSLRMEGGRIVALGDLSPLPGEEVIDGGGLVLAPGFIDTHSHHDPVGPDGGAVEAALSQGITTIVLGQDGGSRSPLKGFFDLVEERGVTVNVASYAGHSAARRAVMGLEFAREATPDEVGHMVAWVEEEMAAGALGLSTGLEYSTATRASTEEVIALARAAGRAGGRYTSHVRSEDSGLWEALEEAIRIGEEAALPVQVSHLKLAQTSWWGQAPRALALLDAARARGVEVTADVYPYTFWGSTIRVFFPDLDYKNPERAQFAVTEVSTPEGIRLSRWGPDPVLTGKTLAEVAEARALPPAEVLMQLIDELGVYEEATPEEEQRGSYITAEGMVEEDIDAILAWPFVNLCSDGGSSGGHPRGYGAFPRLFARFVREREALDLPTAIAVCTGRAARNLGWTDRGTLAPGLAADLVLFDPSAVQDHATVEEPRRRASGIECVWIAGQLVFEASRGVTEVRPGRVLRREE